MHLSKQLKTLLFSVLLSTASPSAVAACELKFASFHIKPHYWLEDGVYQGIAVDFLNILASRSHCKISYFTMPWKRVLRDIELGKIDLTFAFHHPKRALFARYSSHATSTSKFVIFAKQTHPEIKNLTDLFSSNKKLIYPKFWFLGGLQKHLVKNKQLAIPTNSIKKGLELLAADRAPTLLAPKTATIYAIQHLQLEHDILVKSPVLEHLELFIIFSKKSVSSDQYQQLNQILMQLIETDTMNTITGSYIK